MNGQGSYGLKFYIALINITQKTQTVADGNFVDCKTVRIFLLPQGSARALRARKILSPRFTDFCTDFEKKPNCFAV